MAFIEIKNLSKSFGNLKAVNNISFEILEGQIFGLLGPNGAGKSTAISIITTLLNGDSGEIKINGFDIKEHPKEVKKILGLVPQEIALYPTLTARENLLFWGRMYGLKGKILKDRVEEALVIAGLKDREKERVASYSGGMKRRINIVAALLHHPKLVIMDEPTVGIDPQSRNHILETVLKLNKEGMTVIYTSHYMEEVELLCSKIAIMDHGNIIAMGSKEELRKLAGDKDKIIIDISNINNEVIKNLNNIEGIDNVILEEDKIIILAKEGDTLLSKIVSELGSKNCKIHSINIEQSNLENVFLHLTGRALRD